MKGWSPADADKARTGYSRVHEGLAPLLAAGVPIDDDRVQELVHLHHEVTNLFWTPNAEAYRGLGQMHIDDKRFTADIGQSNDALVAYLRDAMTVYGLRRREVEPTSVTGQLGRSPGHPSALALGIAKVFGSPDTPSMAIEVAMQTGAPVRQHSRPFGSIHASSRN